MISTLVSVLAGVTILALGLRFHDLFHPSASGPLSPWVARAFSGALRHRAVTPDADQISHGTIPAQDRFTAFCFLREVMTTPGLGGKKARPDWLRVFMTLHTLIGFAFLTASMTRSVIKARVDRVHIPLAYDFRADDENACLAPSSDRVQLAATALQVELRDDGAVPAAFRKPALDGDTYAAQKAYAGYHAVPLAQ
jgi:hypothetical protein